MIAYSLTGFGNTIIVILGILIGFGALVLVHELGHFIFAKLGGIKVEAFAFGFGPKIIARKRGETDYRINWIPFGGYVKLAGMEGEDGKDARAVERGFYAAKPGARALCIIAGAGFNFIFAIIIFLILWTTGISRPEMELSTTIGSFEENMPAEESSKQNNGLQIGDKILSINDKPIKQWKDIMKVVAFAGTDEFRIKILRNDIEQAISIKSQEDKEIGVYRLGIGPAGAVIVDKVEKNTVAEEIGLRKGDEILSLDDKPVLSLMDFKNKLKNNVNKETEIAISRSGKKISNKFTVPEPIKLPEIAFGFLVGSTKIKLEFPPADLKEAFQYPILGFVPSLVGKLVKVHQSPADSIKETFSMVYSTLGRLFANFIPGSKVTVKPKGLTGPVGIIAFISTSMMVSFSYYVWLIAFLSLNLGIVNLLPIPVLDGGHILFTGIEKVRKKPLSDRTMALITNVFVVLIISFFLYVTYYDSKRNIVPYIKALWDRIFG